MPTLRQASIALARAYHINESRLEAVRGDMAKQGFFPRSTRARPLEATPERVGLMVIGMAVRDPARISALADLRAYYQTPGDFGFSITLGETLTLLVERAEPLNGSLAISTKGTPYGWITNENGPVVCYGESSHVNDQVSPLALVHLPTLEGYFNLMKRKALQAA